MRDDESFRIVYEETEIAMPNANPEYRTVKYEGEELTFEAGSEKPVKKTVAVTHKLVGSVIQLQGDHLVDVKDFLFNEGIAELDQIVIHAS